MTIKALKKKNGAKKTAAPASTPMPIAFQILYDIYFALLV